MCPVRVWRQSPFSSSHTRAVPSLEVVISTLPSAAAATLVSGPVWPPSRSTQSPISMSHTRAVLSADTANKAQMRQRRHASVPWSGYLCLQVYNDYYMLNLWGLLCFNQAHSLLSCSMHAVMAGVRILSILSLQEATHL